MLFNRLLEHEAATHAPSVVQMSPHDSRSTARAGVPEEYLKPGNQILAAVRNPEASVAGFLQFCRDHRWERVFEENLYLSRCAQPARHPAIWTRHRHSVTPLLRSCDPWTARTPESCAGACGVTCPAFARLEPGGRAFLPEHVRWRCVRLVPTPRESPNFP